MKKEKCGNCRKFREKSCEEYKISLKFSGPQDWCNGFRRNPSPENLKLVPVDTDTYTKITEMAEMVGVEVREVIYRAVMREYMYGDWEPRDIKIKMSSAP